MTLYLDPRPKDRLLQFGRELIADGFLQDPLWFERKRKHQHKLIDFGSELQLGATSYPFTHLFVTHLVSLVVK